MRWIDEDHEVRKVEPVKVAFKPTVNEDRSELVCRFTSSEIGPNLKVLNHDEETV